MVSELRPTAGKSTVWTDEAFSSARTRSKAVRIAGSRVCSRRGVVQPLGSDCALSHALPAALPAENHSLRAVTALARIEETMQLGDFLPHAPHESTHNASNERKTWCMKRLSNSLRHFPLGHSQKLDRIDANATANFPCLFAACQKSHRLPSVAFCFSAHCAQIKPTKNHLRVGCYPQFDAG